MTIQFMTYAMLVGKKTKPLNKTRELHKRNRNPYLCPSHTIKKRHLNLRIKEHSQRQQLAPADRRYVRASWPTRETLPNTKHESPHRSSAYQTQWPRSHQNRRAPQTSELTNTQPRPDRPGHHNHQATRDRTTAALLPGNHFLYMCCRSTIDAIPRVTKCPSLLQTTPSDCTTRVQTTPPQRSNATIHQWQQWSPPDHCKTWGP